MKVEIILDVPELLLLLEWEISQNITLKWGCIKKNSSSYAFMHDDINEVTKWLLDNFRK